MSDTTDALESLLRSEGWGDVMCCPLDCKPDLKPDDWTPCIECMSDDERERYQKATGDRRKEGWVPQRFYERHD